MGFLTIGAGGFLGAIARYGVVVFSDRFRGDHVFPLGVLLANVAGCFAIGILGGLISAQRLLPPGLDRFLITGFLGSFTTFSTFGFNTFELIRQGSWGWAVLNVGASLGLGLAAVVAGFAAGSCRAWDPS